MAVPKRRTSRARKGSRRAHHFLTPLKLQYCANDKCEQPVLPHRVCPACGHYQGREVEKIAEKTKDERK